MCIKNTPNTVEPSTDMPLTHLSLFSGIGGLDLAAEWAGFQTIGQCECAKFSRRILEKHWPNTHRWHDIRDITGEDFYAQTGLCKPTIISGGFPCQPFSTAGQMRGKKDDRYLWPEMLRILHELRPTWLLGENVAGLANMALDDILSDLESEGYSARAILFPAAAVGAVHRRNRFAIVAHTDGDGWQSLCEQQSGRTTFTGTDDVPYSRRKAHEHHGAKQLCRSTCEAAWARIIRQSVPSEFCRVANGLPTELDRLRCLGNAVVPQQFYPIFHAIAEIERCKMIY